MLTRRTALSAIPILGLTRLVRAQSSDQVRDVANSSVSQAPVDPAALIDDQMQQFIDEQHFGERERRGELFILRGKAPVQVPVTNPDWVRYRTITYNNALIEAQADFVAEQNTRNMTRTVLDFYKSADEQPPPFEDRKMPGKAADLLRKLVGVAGGKLDKELKDMGVDPREYESAPEAQKTALLTNHLKTTSMQHSLGDTLGLCSVKTFEGHDGTGNYTIGVVAIASSMMRDFVQQILTARGEFPADPARAQDLSRLYADKTGLINDFGVRRLFDENGLPVIVSFGQWASSYRGTDAGIAATYREAARRQAELIADGQISDFLKGSLTYDRSGTVGQEVDRIASSLPDSSSIDDTKRALDEMKRTMIRTSTINITGLRTLTSWSGQHPATQTPIIGVIRIWSAAGESQMRAMMSTKPKGASAVATHTPPGMPGVTESRQLMDAKDF